MEINKCRELFKLQNNYNKDELNNSYNKLLLNYHKNNITNQEIFENLKNSYNYLLSNYEINNNNATNNNPTNHNATNHNATNHNVNNHNVNNNAINNNLANNNTQLVRFGSFNNTSNLSNNSDINNFDFNESNNYLYIEPILIEILITYEEAYNGCSKPLIINRILNNYGILTKETETFYLQIPEGIDEKEIITINNKGNCYNNNYGCIKVSILLEEHKLFKRNGLDLIIEKNISLKESLLGFDFIIIFLNEKKFKINNNNILRNKIKILRNLGFKRDNFKGNLIINFNIIYPSSLNEEQREKLNNIL